LKEKEEIKE